MKNMWLYQIFDSIFSLIMEYFFEFEVFLVYFSKYF